MKETNNMFGILKESNYDKLQEDEQLKVLIEANLYHSITSLSLKPEKVIDFSNRIEIKTSKTNMKPREELIEEFYRFFIAINSSSIDNEFLFFSKDFKDEVFGMEYAEKRKIALKHFKDNYSKVIPKGVSFSFKSISENGLEGLETLNRFVFLESLRTAKSTNLATIQNLKAYLIGNKTYFESTDFMNQEAFKKAINFESTLKILLSLNDTFQFEEDTTFSNLGVLKEQHRQYQNLFRNFEVFKWVQRKIESFIDNKPSNIDSLHQTLLELSLISEKKKSFIDYVNQEHNMSITKIRHYGRDINLSHDFRLIKFKEELQELTSKN